MSDQDIDHGTMRDSAGSQPNSFARTVTGLLPLFILIGGVIAAIGLKVFAPSADRRAPVRAKAITVEVEAIRARDYQVVVESYGTVQPQTESTLVAQVSGLVMEISPNLREGGFFNQGEPLLRIDDRDYVANVSIARAALVNAKQQLAEEQARSNQASADWQRLGNSGEAPALVLRKPQLSAAQAQLASAQSSLDIALLNLERTRIRAPFAGRVLTKSVDVGQVVNPNTAIAEIYATDYMEVRLPLRDRDLPFVELPEDYRHSESSRVQHSPVVLASSLVSESLWQASIVRTESAIDESARQLHVVAQIDDPYGSMAIGRSPLKIGEYVTASINGRTIDNAIVVPVSAIYQSTYAYIVEDNRLQQRTVNIAWQNDNDALISAGLDDGDRLVLTPLGQVTSGLDVIVRGNDKVPSQVKTPGGKSGAPPVANGGQGTSP